MHARHLSRLLIVLLTSALSATQLVAAPPAIPGAQRLDDLAPFLMDEAKEVALARSAAAPAVADSAEVLLLTPKGYRVHAAGTNGFTCLVQRGWSSPTGATTAYFDPRLIAPICFNQEAARTVLQEYFRRTELVLEGRSSEDVVATVEGELAAGTIPAPQRTAIAYMMSPHQWLGEGVQRWMPHVMVYAPMLDLEDLGKHELDSGFPLMFDGGGRQMATVVIPVPSWSDGSATR